MLKIECQNCSAVYHIDPDLIPFVGAKARCNHCNSEMVIRTKNSTILYAIQNKSSANFIVKEYTIPPDKLKSIIVSSSTQRDWGRV